MAKCPYCESPRLRYERKLDFATIANCPNCGTVALVDGDKFWTEVIKQ